LKTADDDETSLGPGLPGCDDIPMCDTGLPKPCGPVVKPYKGSAKIIHEIPPLKPSELIPQPYNNDGVTREVEVEEQFMPFIKEYSYGFWYQFRFRSPVRMEISEKRDKVHAVAGITEKDSYCQSGSMGDRALALLQTLGNHLICKQTNL